MLNIPGRNDCSKMIKGVAVLLLFITGGVTVVDMQFNNLTRQRDFVQLVNLRRDPQNGYAAYFFGNSYHIGAVFPVARIGSGNGEFIVSAGGRTWRLPTQVSVNIEPAAEMLRIWLRQFIAEAHKTKAVLTAYAVELYREAAGVLERCRYLLQGENGK
ncbi:MAG: hypothetical protein N2491_07280 [Negativicutes bacterium]|nr:hypothetical protein [Negativicutes bacterium]